MKALILMIQFMTRYPIPVQIEFTAERFVQGMKWMPLVGLLAALPAAAGFAIADALLGRESRGHCRGDSVDHRHRRSSS